MLTYSVTTFVLRREVMHISLLLLPQIEVVNSGCPAEGPKQCLLVPCVF